MASLFIHSLHPATGKEIALMRYFVGIDWADQKHDICILDSQGRILKEYVIGDDNVGYRDLHQTLQTLNGEVRLLLERPNGLLVDFLVQHRWPIYFIPPNISVLYRPRRSKSDRGDAYLLAGLIWRNDPECRLVVQSSDLCRQLQQIVGIYDKLHREQQRLALQLRYQLKQYYPAVLTVFRKPQQPLTYAFLEAFPDPHQMRQTPLQTLEDFFTAQRYRYRERIAAHWTRLREEAPLSTNTAGYQAGVAAIVAIMQALDAQMRHLKREMSKLYHQHPDYAWLKTLPGLGDLNGARLLARLGDNRARFADPDTLRANAGTAPITRSSGKQHLVQFRKECSHPLRKIFYDVAMNSKAKSAWANDYFKSQLDRGHARTRADADGPTCQRAQFLSMKAWCDQKIGSVGD
jgi:transposase